MEASKNNISNLKLFTKTCLLRIPFFQRAYVWGEKELDRFLQDMQKAKDTNHKHFLGIIILKESDIPKNIEDLDYFDSCQIVIDGQQRLTTLMLFCLVICLKNNTNRCKRWIKNYLITNGEEDTDPIPVLLQDRYDRTQFEEIFRHNKAEKITFNKQHSKLIDTFNYFVDKIQPDQFDPKSVLELTEVVQITLSQKDNEQQIFNAMNSLSIRLTEIDLIKNYIFYNQQDSLYEEKWKNVFEKDAATKVFWSTETGKNNNSILSFFFECFYNIETANNSDKNKYSKDNFIKLIKENYDNRKDYLLEKIHEYAENFIQIFNPNAATEQADYSNVLYRLNILSLSLKITVFWDYILYIKSDAEISDKEKDNIFRVIESYLLRKSICGILDKENKIYFKQLIQKQVKTAKTLSKELANRTDYSKIPSDKDVQEALFSFLDVEKNPPIKKEATQKTLMFLLECYLKEKERTQANKTTLECFNAYSLEFILPKAWEDYKSNWPFANSNLSEEEAKIKREIFIKSLGNKTLVTQKLKSNLNKEPWTIRKCTSYSLKNNKIIGLGQVGQNLITLRDYLDENNWDETLIEKRTEWLNTKFLEYLNNVPLNQ